MAENDWWQGMKREWAKEGMAQMGGVGMDKPDPPHVAKPENDRHPDSCACKLCFDRRFLKALPDG